VIPINIKIKPKSSATEMSRGRLSLDHTAAIPTMMKIAVLKQKQTFVASRLAVAAAVEIRPLSSKTFAGSPPTEAAGVDSLSALPAHLTQNNRR
jgi:hypothetical protein